MLVKIISVGWAYLLLCSYKNIIQYYTDHTEIKPTVNIKKLMMWFCAVLVWLVKENVTTTKVSLLNVWFFNKICTPEYLFNEEQLAAFKDHDLNHY